MRFLSPYTDFCFPFNGVILRWMSMHHACLWFLCFVFSLVLLVIFQVFIHMQRFEQESQEFCSSACFDWVSLFSLRVWDSAVDFVNQMYHVCLSLNERHSHFIYAALDISNLIILFWVADNMPFSSRLEILPRKVILFIYLFISIFHSCWIVCSLKPLLSTSAYAVFHILSFMVCAEIFSSAWL